MIRFASPRAARGVSMIEVLVAIVVFSLGLLGLALMQIRGATFSKESGSRTAAIIGARSLADRMQANPTGVTAGAYVFNSSGTLPSYTDCSITTCTPAQVAGNDIVEWMQRLQSSMPTSSGAAMAQVIDNKDGSYTITVQWSGQNVIQAGNETVADSFVYVPTPGAG